MKLTRTNSNLPRAVLGTALLLQTSLMAQSLDPWMTVYDEPRGAGQLSSATIEYVDPAGNLYGIAQYNDGVSIQPPVLRKSSDGGSTWTVIQNWAGKMCGDSQGAVYAGTTISASGLPTHWIIRKSVDGGMSWTIVDDVIYAQSVTNFSLQRLASDAGGNIYAGGSATTYTSKGPQTHLVIRRGANWGTTWTTIDNYVSKTGDSMGVTRIAGSGNAVFVAGSGVSGGPNSTQHWLVRKGSPTAYGAWAWSFVDDFQYTLKPNTVPQDMVIAPDGTVYVAGGAAGVWLVRRGTSAGTVWSTVDQFQAVPGKIAAAYGIATDSTGTIWVGGEAVDDSGEKWVVRKSSTGQARTWEMSDCFALGQTAWVSGLLCDLTGTLYANGIANDSQGASHWLVRQLVQ